MPKVDLATKVSDMFELAECCSERQFGAMDASKHPLFFALSAAWASLGTRRFPPLRQRTAGAQQPG
jgi:hypothetical protein